MGPAFAADLAAARNQARAQLVDGLGPYASLVEQLQALAGTNFNWVRDVTVSNSTWGNRHLHVFDSRAGVHALGGGIGQGLAMGIGAAVGAAATASGKKTFTLAGDGGFILNLGELQELGSVRALLEDVQRVEMQASGLQLSDALRRDMEQLLAKHGGKLEFIGHPTTTLEELFLRIVEQSKAHPGRRYLPEAGDGKGKPVETKSEHIQKATGKKASSSHVKE